MVGYDLTAGLHGLRNVAWGALAVVMVLMAGCQWLAPEGDVVVVYTSVDQPFAEPILDAYQERTGVEVRAVYDVEAAKTTGLVNRLIAEKDQPKADVFWNNEIVQTMVLKEKGVLEAYASPEAEGIPATYRDPASYWTGMTARARVFIVNAERVAAPEDVGSIYDLLDPGWPGEDVGIAYPLFGTTATHAAALYEALGREEALGFFEGLVERGVRVVDGNSVVRDLVADGEMTFGLTDTDDACGAVERGKPVVITLPDQDELGTLLIPSTVMLIADAPHEEQGRALVDYLLSKEVEQALIDAGYSHIALHEGIDLSASCVRTGDIRGMDVDFGRVYRHFDAVQEDLREVFLQ